VMTAMRETAHVTCTRPPSQAWSGRDQCVRKRLRSNPAPAVMAAATRQTPPMHVVERACSFHLLPAVLQMSRHNDVNARGVSAEATTRGGAMCADRINQGGSINTTSSVMRILTDALVGGRPAPSTVMSPFSVHSISLRTGSPFASSTTRAPCCSPLRS
jgi:hypothetical protein